jgi:hypothetical protein
VTIPCDDWFHDHPPDRHRGLQKGITTAWNGMDRIYNGRWEDVKDPALFEFVIETRPEEELTALILRPDEGIFTGQHTRFNLFAVTAIREP